MSLRFAVEIRLPRWNSRRLRPGLHALLLLCLVVTAVPVAVFASDRFVDVPDGLFHDEIGTFANAGITLGCGVTPPRYCPNDPVTRGQMAAFFVRGFGLSNTPNGIGLSLRVGGTQAQPGGEPALRI